MQPVEKHYTREGMYENIVEKLKESGLTTVTRKDIGGCCCFRFGLSFTTNFVQKLVNYCRGQAMQILSVPKVLLANVLQDVC